MAEFPPNLDDGELWLPSDIFPDEVVPSKCNPRHYSDSDLTYIDDFAHSFAALAFLERHRSQTVPKFPPKLSPYSEVEQFGPAVRYSRTGSLPQRYFSFNGGFEVGRGLRGCGTEGLFNGAGSISHFSLNSGVQQSQVKGFVEARARVLQKQRKDLLQNRVLENRFLPFQGTVDRSGVALGGGGFVSEYGGTGVFLPRIATTAFTDPIKTKGVRNGQDSRVIPQRSYMRKVDQKVGKQEECHYHLPPEIGLPQDWTY